MIIEASAPTRVDLAGGTVDIWPLYLFHSGAQTVNFAIDLYATSKLLPREDGIVRIESKDTGAIVEMSLAALTDESELELLSRIVKFFAPTQGLTLITECAAPPGSGLGGSSTLAIAVCGALNEFTGRGYSAEEILTIAKNLETQVIRVPAGVQDYYPAMYGGVNALHLKVVGIEREAIEINLSEMAEHFILCYTGKPHFSGTNNWEITKRHIDNDPQIFHLFEKIRDITIEMRAALVVNDLARVAYLLDQEWQTRKELAPGVSTPKIEELIVVARQAGSLAAKVCGAGGGGCMIFITPPALKAQVASAIASAGGQLLDFQIASQGLKVSRLD